MSRLGPYRVLGTLGRGAQGRVLLALDTRLQRHVALKRYPLPAARGARRRALREARRYSVVDDPRVTRVLDVVDDGRELMLVLQYVPGCDLEEALGRHRLSIASALALCGDIAAALAAAHRHHIVHGDLKAGNVLIGEDGHALLTDFGVAVAAAAGRGDVVSPSARSPEHLRGAVLEPRSDLYALGRLLYRMLAGHDPFPGPQAPERLLTAAYRPLSRSAAGEPLPPALVALVSALLAPAPVDRPASALLVRRQLRAIARERPASPARPVVRELADCLRRGAAPASPPRLPSSLQAAARRRQRRTRLRAQLRRPPVVAALSLLLLVTAGSAAWRLSRDPPCVALEAPRISVAPGTPLAATVTRPWLQTQLAAALTARRPLRVTGHDLPGARLALTREGRRFACTPRQRLRLVLDCRPTLCLLGLRRGAEVALFPDAAPARWSRAVARLAASR